ncbi:hypothetical protein [Pseudomonas fluorescens]|uniref:hypothetical protein n=1 Tax=Pseudomonas fluorescens TaxID=294 RepID=UPI000CD02557|nr:hypothetical protein [Pseudomonas fluorescens]PNY72321.1 hypothetical protein C1751_23120 [Pseudomonas fluorescens]
MSLMRMNHVRNELKSLSDVIASLIKNHERDLTEYNTQASESESNFTERESMAHSQQDWDALREIHIEKLNNTQPLKVIESLAKLQNELILVKHVALIESMIVQTFWCLTHLLSHQEYQEEYFSEQTNFSDGFKSASKILELTNGELNLKSSKFWSIFETLKPIRNTIAHGDPLFIISYRRATKFNKQIDLIHLSSEKNECSHTKSLYPSRPHPSYEPTSKWFCSLKSDLGGIVQLNKKCIDFVEEVRSQYLKFGELRGISKDMLYACRF